MKPLILLLLVLICGCAKSYISEEEYFDISSEGRFCVNQVISKLSILSSRLDKVLEKHPKLVLDIYDCEECGFYPEKRCGVCLPPYWNIKVFADKKEWCPTSKKPMDRCLMDNMQKDLMTCRKSLEKLEKAEEKIRPYERIQ